MSASALTRSSSSVAVARCCASRSRPTVNSASQAVSFSRTTLAWVALSPSRFAAASATFRCVSQSADGPLVCGGGGVEFGTCASWIGWSGPVAPGAVDGFAVAKLGQPGAQCVDFVVTDEAVGRRGQLVAGTGQFSAALIEDARRRDVVDSGSRQRRRQNLLCGIELGLGV